MNWNAVRYSIAAQSYPRNDLSTVRRLLRRSSRDRTDLGLNRGRSRCRDR